MRQSQARQRLQDGLSARLFLEAGKGLAQGTEKADKLLQRNRRKNYFEARFRYF
ncbi:hypothetical protein PLA106_14084 [Pseudomonas amygdali pv. lachrymans str. M302278]|nr:hypothetical protein PLA106_14084 [Pseudomonas amygdali pv. lachrymans str. M302278]